MNHFSHRQDYSLGQGKAFVATRLTGPRKDARASIGFNARPPSGSSWRGDGVHLPDDTHLMTIAPTGAGKGVSCLIPALLQYPGPVIVFDPKGENAAVTARRRREMGQKVIVVDPFHVSGEPPARFNPLDFVEADTAEVADDATAIAEMLMSPHFDLRNSFWRDRALHFLTTAVIHAVTDFYPGRRNLSTVRDIVHRMSKLANRSAVGVVGKETVASFALKSRSPEVNRLNDLFDLGAIETVGGMLHTALDGVGFVSGQLVEQSLSESDFNLDDVTEGEPLTIYLVLPPHLIPSHGALLRVWLGTLFNALMRRTRRPEHSTLLLLDEAAQLGSFQPLQTAVTLLRGYGLQTWSFWQDASQLVQTFPQDWRSLVNNCGIVQLFGPRAIESAAVLGLPDVDGAAGNSSGCGGSDILVFDRDGGCLAERLDYRTDPAFDGLFDQNPLHRRAGGRIRKPKVRHRGLPAAEPSDKTGLPASDFRQIYKAIRSSV